MPTPQHWHEVRERAQDPQTRIEIAFKLSGKVHDHWRVFFNKGWRIWYETNPPIVHADYIIISCLPSEISIMRGMVKAMIAEANSKSEPFISDALRIKAIQDKQRDRLHELEQYQAEPVAIPHTKQGDQLRERLRHKYQRDRQDLQKELAREQMDAALSWITEADTLEVSAQSQQVLNALDPAQVVEVSDRRMLEVTA